MKCDIHDAITKSDDSYRATFIWLLSPLRLDFIDDNFKESKEGLFWDGEVSGIPTSITIELPLQEAVYAAWEEPVGHCHGHVWWTMPVPSPSPEVTPVVTPPGFETIIAITSILAVAYLALRKEELEK